MLCVGDCCRCSEVLLLQLTVADDGRTGCRSSSVVADVGASAAAVAASASTILVILNALTSHLVAAFGAVNAADFGGINVA